MKYSGKTIAELETLAKSAGSDVFTLAAIKEELLRRKYRRDQKQQGEKRQARELRTSLSAEIGRILSASPERLDDFFSANDHVNVEVTSADQSTIVIQATRDQLIASLKSVFLIRIQHRGRWIAVDDYQPPTKTSNSVETRTLRPHNAQVVNRQQVIAPDLQIRTLLAPVKQLPSLTSEQQLATELFRTKDSLKINAFAGTGKTTTLMALAGSTSRSGLYLAFNRAIVNESKEKFPSNVQCDTTHALAFRSIRKQYKNPKKLTEHANAKRIVTDLDIPAIESVVHLEPYLVACLILATIKRFTLSRARSVREVKLPLWGVLSTIRDDSPMFQDLSEQVHTQAERVWAKMCSPQSTLPLGHDGYLKLWAMTSPKLQCDFLLVDEAQDTNDVLLDVFEKQSSQMVYVGDKYQQIYEWRGAVNALDKISTVNSCDLRQSFRFGPQIATVANKILAKLKATKHVIGSSQLNSILCNVDLPDVIIGRTNSGILTSVADLYGRGVKVYVEGGIGELKRLVGAIYDLEKFGSSTAPEFFGFHRWDEIVKYSETEAGKDLVSFVSLVNSLGKGKLWKIIASCEQSPDTANVTVSTAHRAKGREWNSVRLLNDFVAPETDESGNMKPLSDEDHRILYVAATRAKRQLDLGETASKYLGIHR